jgi:hypothetical protein
MRVRVRIPSTPLFWKRGSRNGEAVSIRHAGESRLAIEERSEAPPTISVTCAPGDLASGPKVALGVKLAGKQGLLIEMNAHEASDLANELLIAVRMSERKYQLRFGMG